MKFLFKIMCHTELSLKIGSIRNYYEYFKLLMCVEKIQLLQAPMLCIFRMLMVDVSINNFKNSLHLRNI